MALLLKFKRKFSSLERGINICVLVVAYVVVSGVFSIFTGYETISSINQFHKVVVSCFAMILMYAAYVLVKCGGKTFKDRVYNLNIIYIILSISRVAAVVVLLGVFASMKNTMSYFLEFSWDSRIADIDRYFHFGVDAWRVYSPLIDMMPYWVLDIIYAPVWVFMMVGVAAHCILFEKHAEFQRRFLNAYFLSWVILGNIVAAMFLSSGPIFYSSFENDEYRFYDLIQFMRDGDFDQTATYRVQYYLLKAHALNLSEYGTGISAFPSLHVAMATLSALYISRKCPILSGVCIFYVICIQVSSVLTGYHYAIDGYVSIAFVLLLWSFYVKPVFRSEASFREGLSIPACRAIGQVDTSRSD